MTIPPQFHHFWRHEISQIQNVVTCGETLAVCGLYGIGKNILTDIICQKLESEDKTPETKIIRISLKDLPHPDRQSIFKIITAELTGDHSHHNFQNDFDFHYFLRRVIKNRPNTKFVFIFEESQNLLEFPDSFFESFESLRYYFSPRISLLFFGQPQMYNFPTSGFSHLVKNNYIFLKPFDEKTTNEDIYYVGAAFRRPKGAETAPLLQNSIFHFSHGHHGTIKFLLQKLDKSPIPNPKFQTNPKTQNPKNN